MDPNIAINWNEAKEQHFKSTFPIHRACRDGDYKYLRDLFNHNASAVNHLLLEDEYYGWTPAHWAAFFGKLDCLKLLDSIPTNGFKLTAIKSAKFSQTCGHLAAFGSNPQCLMWLLQAGADPNIQDYIEDTPLHKAARSGSLDCVTLLINNKANVRSVNNQGQSAAILSRDNKHQNVAEYLFKLQNKDMNTTHSVNTSSNGYYGYQHTHVAPSVEGMDTDSSNMPSVVSQNGFNQQPPFSQTNGFGQITNGFAQQNGHSNGFGQITGHSNGFSSQNGHINGFGQVTGRQINGFSSQNGLGNQNGHSNGFGQTNGHSGFRQPNGNSNAFGQSNSGFLTQNAFGQSNGHSNGFGQQNCYRFGQPISQNGNGVPPATGTTMNIFQSNDITLSYGSISNITVGGRKRSREEASLAPEGKRPRMKEPSYDLSTLTNTEIKIVEETNNQIVSSAMEIVSVDSVPPPVTTTVIPQPPSRSNGGSGFVGSHIPICNNDVAHTGFRTYCTRSYGGHYF